jgi:DNA ligase D-like protein (predicted ligase)
MTRLPEFVPPMLAKIGGIFDSPEHLYEIKWDGIRALSFVEDGNYRMVSRRKNSLKERYPEIAFLEKLPSGTLLDGELVVLRDGQPDIGLILQREQARSPRRVRALMRQAPVVYVVFDLLYRQGERVLDWTLVDRRDALRGIVEECAEPALVFSDDVVGEGIAFFEEATKRKLEGIVAKRCNSRYLPGKRTDAWIKIKRTNRAYCAIIGFVAEANEVRSLVVAEEEGGVLKYAGRVGSGLDDALRTELYRRLSSRVRGGPFIPVPQRGGAVVWVEPELYCAVKFLERTANGEFRAPVFGGLIEE